MTGDRGNNDAPETEPDYQQFGHPVEPLRHWRHEWSQGAGLLVAVASTQAQPGTAAGEYIYRRHRFDQQCWRSEGRGGDRGAQPDG